MTEINVSGKVAIVTGGSRGIGVEMVWKGVTRATLRCGKRGIVFGIAAQ